MSDFRSQSSFDSVPWQAFALALSLALGGGARAAAPPGVWEALQACAQEREDGARLSCYDREMAHPEKSFGLNDQQIKKLDPQRAAVDAAPTTLSSTVVSTLIRPDGRTRVTLGNGQVWVQGEAFEELSIRVGDPVTIKSGLLNSHYLSVPSGRRTRVTRER